MSESTKKYLVPAVFAALILATLIAFEPVRHNEFVDYDDGQYITKNPHVKAGITYKSFIWALKSPDTGNWHPLTWLSHMLDCELFGLSPVGHHLTNLLFHIANSLLLFLLLKRMTGALWPSAFVAAVFALHPLRVESVAWASERKDVLSVFFLILTIAAYIRYVRCQCIRRYCLVVLTFCLGLMAKPMLVTLPFVLFLLDYWPLNRFGLQKQDKPKVSSISHLIAEKIPLLVLAAISSIVTLVVQSSAGATKTVPLYLRIGNGLVSYVGYIGKTIYPSRLAAFYPHPGIRLPMWQPIVCFVMLAVITIVVIYTARRRRYLIVGWLWYLGTLIPVIGLVQVGVQAMADRYTYLPSIGIYMMAGWGAAELVTKLRLRKIELWVSAGIVLAALIICTRMQVRHWQNNLTLFGHCLEVTERNYNMHSKYGRALRKEGRFDEAVKHFNKSLQINPRYFLAQYNLGQAYLMQGKTEQAVDSWYKTLELNPDYVRSLNNLAWLIATHRQSKFYNPQKALLFAKRACELTKYENAGALDTLAVAYAAAGRFSEAVATGKKAIQIAESIGQQDLAGQIKNRVELFKAGQAYYEPVPAKNDSL